MFDSDEPFDRAAFDESRDACVTLWRAVLTTAVRDTLGDNEETERAHAWIDENGPNFRTVCHMAGFDPDFIRERTLATLNERTENTSPETVAAAA